MIGWYVVHHRDVCVQPIAYCPACCPMAWKRYYMKAVSSLARSVRVKTCGASKLSATEITTSYPSYGTSEGQARHEALTALLGVIQAHRQVLGLFARAHQLDSCLGQPKPPAPHARRNGYMYS